MKSPNIVGLYLLDHPELGGQREFVAVFSRWMEVLGMATQPDHQNISPDMNGTGMHV